MTRNPINDIEGGAHGTNLKILRNKDEELDNAIIAPNKVSASSRKENDVKITKRLSEHGWTRHSIRKVLLKKNSRDALKRGGDDTYFKDVLKKAGYHRTYSSDTEIVDTEDYSSDDDSETDSSGVTTDSSSIDASKYKHIKF